MNKRIVSLALFCASCAASVNLLAQSTTAAVVYYMPQVQLALDIEYQQVVRHRGPFYQYAERYLGEKNIVVKDETTYELVDVSLVSKTVADKSRSYTFVPSAKGFMQFALSDKGMLCSIGDVAADTPKDKEKKCRKEKEAQAEMPALTYPGLLEEQMLASSIGKMAEGVAKQIYHIRESRLNILTGEAEHAPADGQSLHQMLARLDAEEARLTALFVGSTTCSTMHKVLPLALETADHAVAFRFSLFDGPVDADELSGEPVYCTLSTTKATVPQVEVKKQPLPSPFYYNIPGSAHLLLNQGEKTLIDKEIIVPQLGVSIPLADEVVRNAKGVRFCPKTGQLIEIK